MERLTGYILAGFCTLLFGGMAAKSASVNSTLAETLTAFRGRTVATGVAIDLGKIAQDSKKAQRALLNEREKG